MNSSNLSNFFSPTKEMKRQYQFTSILASLPLVGDKNIQGKTRKQISEQTGLTPDKVSRRLSTLKRQRKVKLSRQRYWRKTKLS